ncbi:hypothetical protein GDO86_013470 [Hymenochirus boettgeri]|uniref:Uncharacterized protein n=1 Tax=Hymenochirus boettgeri TaxID=247094 RepID=A0A8T2IRI7_9PIPI|nr:hypothetical protein GDO86_013470 [Hymenochirus boettgeri]
MEGDGFCFEDSVFTEPRDRSKGRGDLYKAKKCEPEWFTEETNSEDSGEVHTALKFRADLAYRQKDFEKAFSDYCDCFVLLPPNNTAMRRDVQESQARCLVHLGRYPEALRIASTLERGVFNTDHLTCSLNLQITIYEHIGNLGKLISCMHQLVSLHPFNGWIWKRLAELYLKAHGSAAEHVRDIDNVDLHAGETDEHFYAPANDGGKSLDLDHFSTQKDVDYCNKTLSEPSLGKNFTKRDLWMCSCASFIRARLLFQLVHSQQASFVLAKNLMAQEEIEEELKYFKLDEKIKKVVTEMMEWDLSSEHIKEEGCVDTKSTLALTSYRTPSDREFKDRWFKNIITLWS